MKHTIALVASLVFLTSISAGQKRKSARQTGSGTVGKSKPAPAIPPVVGAQISIATKSGEQITGQVLEFNAYTVRVKQGDLESTVPLESVVSMRFGDAPAAASGPPQPSGHGPDFARDSGSLMALFQSMDSATESGTEYSDYGTRLVELRRATERFVGKYAGSEDQIESRLAALFSAALDDYSWARTIWTLRLGQGPAATIAAADSPAVSDALELYPDLAKLGPRNKLPADKLVAALWKQASVKVAGCRRIVESAR
jgi:hypothetical protein